MKESQFPRRLLSRRAFTLIELLTVIAIIGILAAILIPVVAKVRQSASQAVSISNMRQIGIGIQAFAADHNDRLPGVYRTLNGQPDPGYSLGGGQSPYATPTLRTSLGHPDQLGPYIESSVRIVDGTERRYVPLLESPAYARSRPPNEFPTSHLRAESVRHGNGRQLLPSPFGVGTGDEGRHTMSMTLGQMERLFTPSRRWAMIEIDESAPINVIREAGGSWPWPVINGSMHGNSWTALMFDGSVRVLREGDPLLDNQRTQDL
jgi:prepilin-type N-terminal cleavage/methylation domain-containing protein